MASRKWQTWADATTSYPVKSINTNFKQNLNMFFFFALNLF